MNLIPLNTVELGGECVETVDARELHSFLEVSTSFKDWIRRRIEDYGFREDSDFCSFLSESSGGRPAREYAVTLDMAKELSMVERSEKGREARRYFIECERVARSKTGGKVDRMRLKKIARCRAQIADATRRLEELGAPVNETQGLLAARRDGLAVFVVDGEPVLVDTRDWDVGSGAEFALIDPESADIIVDQPRAAVEQLPSTEDRKAMVRRYPAGRASPQVFWFAATVLGRVVSKGYQV